MIELFEAENFRCFELLKLSDLARVNIITGENASGKTALLEALCAAAKGNSEGLVLLNLNRGIAVGSTLPGLPMVVAPIQFPALWDHFFYSSKKNGVRATSNKATLSFTDSDHKHYSVSFELGSGAESVAQPSPVAGIGGVTPLTISRTITEAGQPPLTSSAVTSLGPQGQILNSIALPNLGPSTFIFPAAFAYAETDNVTWYSQLREKDETEEILTFFKTNFPFLSNLEILAPAGVSGIYATLSAGGVRRLQLLSAGVYKIMSLLLGCARSEGGIILIDEIENGIFYDKYALTWYILNKFSQKNISAKYL